MSAIRGQGNLTTEVAFVSFLRRHHLHGWRRHVALPGRPDFVFRSARLAVFVDGCFWHGCPRCYRAPRNNAAYWADKLLTNRRRDRKVCRELRAKGWSVCRVWEHALRESPERVAKRIARILEKNTPSK